jgi:hypothetical protein
MWYQWFIAGADDHHRLAIGLFGIGGELARHRDDLIARTPVIFSAQAGV